MSSKSEVFHGLSTVFFVALTSFFIAGVVFGVHIMFYGPEARIAQFGAYDLVLRQKLYNESNARLVKDNILLEQNAELRVDLNEEAVTREAEYEVLLNNITVETLARIEEEQILFYGVGNETDARVAADLLTAEGVANVTTGVLQVEAYDVFSDTQFMIKMANITYMDNLLMGEIVGRMTKRQQLADAGALSDSTIAYLILQLANEIHFRIVYDTLIEQELLYITGGTIVEGINFINGTLGNININSTTPATLTITTVAGLLTFVNHGVCTINSVSPNAGTGNMAFTHGAGLTIDTIGVPANSWRISSTVLPVPANYQTLTGISITDSTSAPDIDQTSGYKIWQSVGCMSFPSFNGGTCGWTAPDNGAYIVQVIMTMTVTRIFGASDSVHMSMGVGIGNLASIGSNPDEAVPETGGSIFILDSVMVGDYRAPFDQIDVTLGGTVVIQGAGTNVGGCGEPPACGYGIRVFYKADNGYVAFNNFVFPAAIVVTYRWTRAT